MAVKKPVVTIKVELPVMTTAQALSRANEIIAAIKEKNEVRVKAVGVTLP